MKSLLSRGILVLGYTRSNFIARLILQVQVVALKLFCNSKYDVGLLLTGDGMLLLIVVSGQAPHVADVALAVVVVLESLAVADQRLPLGRRLHVVAAAGAAATALAAAVLVVRVDPVRVVAGDVDEIAVHPLVARPERQAKKIGKISLNFKEIFVHN